MNIIFAKRGKFILLALLIIVVYGINKWASADWIENIYLNHLYQWIRAIYQHTIYHLPFPFVYMVFPLMIIILFVQSTKFLKYLFKKEFIKSTWSLLSYLGLLYVLFYALWGFNYKLKPIKQKIHLSEVKLDTTSLINEITNVMHELEITRNLITIDTSALSIKFRPIDLMELIRDEQKKILANFGYPTQHNFHIRELKPNGSLLIFSTAGIYFPYSLEGHYDGGMFHVHSSFVVAHEMAHGYGVTDEGECNFVGLLTCFQSENPYIRYAGLVMYWRYLMGDLRDKAPYSFYFIAYQRPIGLRRDIKEIYKHLDRYPDVIPNIRDLFYDSYLKMNGVHSGIKSYDEVVDLMIRWKRIEADKTTTYPLR